MITREARIGRLLAACLHQAIVEVLPERLDFYEVWLRSEGLRDGSIGAAPITAVLGFLRTEDAYSRVMARAGALAAEWTLASLSPLRCRLITMLPRPWRARAALRIAAGVVRHVCSTSRASTSVGRKAAHLDVDASLFCTVRELQKRPLCGFYAAVATETLGRFGLSAHAHVECCRAVEGGSCVIAFDVSGVDTGVAAS